MLALLITTFCFLVSAIYASQVLLQESFWNFSLIVVMGIVLTFGYIVLVSFFESVLLEFNIAFETFEVLIVSTLPLIASSLVTWFLCVEIPALDIVTCFTLLYFFYTLVICKPRKISKQERSRRGTINNNPTVISTIVPLHIMKVVYILPVIISFCIHIAVHHNVLSTSHTRYGVILWTV